MNNYKFYSILFSLIGGLTIGQLFGYYEGLAVSILLFIFFYINLKLYRKDRNELIEQYKDIKFTR